MLAMESTQALFDALALIRADSSLSATDTITRVTENSPLSIRRSVRAFFEKALIRPETGRGHAFQEGIIERAIRLSQQENAPSQTVPHGAKGRKRMDENSGATKQPVVHAKKHTIGDTYTTVATMGLKPTDTGRDAACPFQFSRKVEKQGTMDLPAGSTVQYVGNREVYAGQAASKRMVFRVTAGSTVHIDGTHVALDHDIDIAGVPNHIDPDDPYNIQLRANEAKKADKAALKAQATAKKTAAA